MTNPNLPDELKGKPTIFYAELDALLDTRYGTLVMLDPLVIPELYVNKFWHRITDEMHLFQKRVSKEDFEKAYKERTEEVLPHALMTMMVIELSLMVLKAEKLHATTGGTFPKPQVVINIHPYDLSEIGKDRIIGAIMHRVGFLTSVKVINEPQLNITPTVMKQREYSHVIMYHYDEWFQQVLRVQQEQNIVVGCPQVEFFLPQIGTTEEKIKEKQIQLMSYPELPDDLFSLFQQTFAAVAAIRFHPVELFSAKLQKDSE